MTTTMTKNMAIVFITIQLGVNMISNDDLNKIIEKAQKDGYSVKVRDISYILLRNNYEDYSIAYISLYGSVDKDEIEKYENSKEIAYLKKAISKYIHKRRGAKEGDITFEENKAYMLKLKADTEKAMADGEIETKDGLKILADISVKLNDKFAVSDMTKEQLIYVNVKYNSICEKCGAELYIPTKEDLMKEYNLIEKDSSNE